RRRRSAACRNSPGAAIPSGPTRSARSRWRARRTPRRRLTMQESAPEPWEQLRSLLQDGNAAALASALDALAPADAARALARLETGEQVQLLQTLPPERVAELVLELPQSLTLILLEELDTPHAAAIVDLLPSDEQADIIAEVDEEK